MKTIESEGTCGVCNSTLKKFTFISGNELEYCEKCSEARDKEILDEQIAREENTKRMYLSDNIPAMYSNEDFGPPELNEMKNKSVLIYGEFGTGKTFRAYGIAKNLYYTEAIRSFRVERAFRMMMNIKNSFKSDNYEKVVKSYTATGLLVIDEWGKNTGTEFEESVLFEIVNTRYENLRETIIIINAKDKVELARLMRPDVLDRFRGGLIEINGKSRR